MSSGAVEKRANVEPGKLKQLDAEPYTLEWKNGKKERAATTTDVDVGFNLTDSKAGRGN